jgi:hypothetical protein
MAGTGAPYRADDFWLGESEAILDSDHWGNSVSGTVVVQKEGCEEDNTKKGLTSAAPFLSKSFSLPMGTGRSTPRAMPLHGTLHWGWTCAAHGCAVSISALM